MASFTITTLQTAQQFLTGGQTGIVSGPDAQLIVPALSAIILSGTDLNRLLIDGTVIASGDPGPAVQSSGGTQYIQVGAKGYVTALSGSGFDLLTTETLHFANAGLVQSPILGVALWASDAGAFITASNSGTIQGRYSGIQIDSGDTTHQILNTGTVIAEQGHAIYANFLDASSTGTAYFYNSGTVQGNFGSYNALNGAGANYVTNAGVMVGNVYLGAGQDRYLGATGRIAGTVYGDADNDLLVGGADGERFDGGSGDDRVYGGPGDDEIAGGTENDTLNGQDGDDTLDGGLGSDVLLGQAGVDYLVGAAGNDTLDGGEGDDSLYGGANADVLRGRGGIDYIDGGLGRDVTEGGPGADVFIFNMALDSTPDANRDVILDFETGLDTINLVNVVPGVFVFRGTLGFTSTGGPELRLQELADGSTIVHMDLDGNGSADMQIRTAGVTGLTAGDFEL